MSEGDYERIGKRCAEFFGKRGGDVPISTNPKAEFGAVKPNPALIPPIAELEESVVLALGAKKYGPYNWRDQPVDAMTYLGAIRRHFLAYMAGEEIDPLEGPNGQEGSGVSHLASIRACCAILMDARVAGTLIDNRPAKVFDCTDLLTKHTKPLKQESL